MHTKVPAHCSADVCVWTRKWKGLLSHCFLTSSVLHIYAHCDHFETRPQIHVHVSLVWRPKMGVGVGDRDSRSWSWTRRSGSIYHRWSSLLCAVRAGQRAKENLLENLKHHMMEWKIQQGNLCVSLRGFHIQNRPLLYCWVSKVKSLRRSSSNNSSLFQSLEIAMTLQTLCTFLPSLNSSLFRYQHILGPQDVTSVENVRICQHSAL